MEICACPQETALTTIIKKLCKENFGQLQRFIWQRAGWVFDAGAVAPKPIGVLSSWTPLFAAAGDTKVVSTPYIENFVIPRTEAISEGGGDNTTIDGIPIVLGGNAVTAIGQIAETPSAIIKQVRKLMCEPDLVWYSINNAGAIIAKDLNPEETDPDAKQYTGVNAQSLFVSDSDNNGLNTRDKADFSYGLGYGWRDDVVVIQPAFNAKTQLWPA